MFSLRFRRQLRQEVRRWNHEGLIDSQVYWRLARRYDLDRFSEIERGGWQLMALELALVLGGALALLGVVLTWGGWLRSAKVLLALVCFLGVNVTGYSLWRWASEGWRTLGQGLLLCGALIWGGAMALLGDLFYQGYSGAEFYWLWALGVGTIALSLGLESLGLLGLALIGVAIGVGASQPGLTGGVALLQQHTPLVLALAGLGLAYGTRSVVIFSLTLVAIALDWLRWAPWSDPWVGSLVLLLVPSFLWVYPRRIGSIGSQLPILMGQFRGISRTLSLTILAMLLYGLSFAWFWPDPVPNLSSRAVAGLPYLDLVVYGGVTAFSWLVRLSRPSRSGLILNDRVMAVLVSLPPLLWLWHYSGHPIAVLGPRVINGLLVILAIGLVHDGLTLGRRGGFWSGLLLIGTVILSRLIEVETDFLDKVWVFAGCGLLALVAGLLFERRRLWLDEDPDAIADADRDEPGPQPGPQPGPAPREIAPMASPKPARSMARSMVLESNLRSTEAHPEGHPEFQTYPDRRSIWSLATEGDRSELADAIAVEDGEGSPLGQPLGQPGPEDQTILQSGRIALGERP
jgi:uncharacterized membrane protein